MFQINEVVVHYREGIAKIYDRVTINGTEYFLLKAKRGDDISIYVPVEKAFSIIRPVMDKENAIGILKYMKSMEVEFNANTKQRRDDFKRRLISGDIFDIAYLVKQLYLYESADELPPKVKFGPVDFDILKNAQNMFLDEMSISLDHDRETVGPYLEKLMDEMD